MLILPAHLIIQALTLTSFFVEEVSIFALLLFKATTGTIRIIIPFNPGECVARTNSKAFTRTSLCIKVASRRAIHTTLIWLFHLINNSSRGIVMIIGRFHSKFILLTFFDSG